MLRDRFAGSEMARLMSTAMAVFMIVPVLAPGLGSAVMAVAPWRAVMWIPVAMGVLMIFWTRQLPETLPPERRRPFNRASVSQAIKLVVTTRETLCFGLAAAFLFGVMSGYLTNSELILDGVYGYGRWFSLFFGAVATTFAMAALLNARFVGRVGLYRWTTRVSLLTLTTSVVFAFVAALTDGRPPFWLMTLTLVAFIPTIQALIPNCNTAALVPLSQVAGTASALTGTATTAIGSLIGNRLSAAFDDTTRPYAYGALACVVIAVSLIRLGVPAENPSK
jgi:DHA1 family bicyclomycin/chloramphenicol resistance-like MFS transporter